MTCTPPQDSISFLLAQICKAHRGCAEENLNHIGLHAGQEMFLMHLWEADGLTQSQLAERMGVQPPTVNKMLARLEASGLVTRREDAEDRRVSRVYLTEHACSLRQRVDETWGALEERTIASLTLDERVLLRRLLMQVYANLTKP